jgi:hypothetical protein
MPKYASSDYPSIARYREFLDAFDAVVGLVLFEFAREPVGTRDLIIRNFIARTGMSMRAIMNVWLMDDFQDCWILHRSLLDRLFHLRHLADHDEFEVFESWSFLRQYKAATRLQSDPEFGGARARAFVPISDDQTIRGQELLGSPPQWRRPKAADVAKSMNMNFMYQFGYDYGSTHVHPMANDGDQDFHTLTGLTPPTAFPDSHSVLSNSLLHSAMVVQVGLSASSFSWRSIVFDFFTDCVIDFLDTGGDSYKLAFIMIGNGAQSGIQLAERV